MIGPLNKQNWCRTLYTHGLYQIRLTTAGVSDLSIYRLHPITHVRAFILLTMIKSDFSITVIN